MICEISSALSCISAPCSLDRRPGPRPGADGKISARRQQLAAQLVEPALDAAVDRVVANAGHDAPDQRRILLVLDDYPLAERLLQPLLELREVGFGKAAGGDDFRAADAVFFVRERAQPARDGRQ